MKIVVLILSLVVPTFFTNSDVEKVKEMDRQLNKLILAHEAKAAASYYADDFILTTSAGKVKSKQDLLQEIISPDVSMEINETTDVKVRVLESTAVLTGILHQKGIYKGNAFDAKLLVTDTWVKVGTEWKILAGHATLLK